MLIAEEVLLPSRPGAIRRLLEQGLDGTFLYSCLSTEVSKRKHEEVWLFEKSTGKDTLIYINDSREEIVNATLNPARNVIAFTTFANVNCHSSENPILEAKNELNTSTSEIPHWTIPPPTYRKADQKEECVSGDNKPVKGKYASYVADVYPSKWISKFNMDRNAYQRVVFTNCCISRHLDECSVTENRLLFIMHRSKIGLYTVYLENESSAKVKLRSAPRGVLIAKKAFWSQWDPLRQLLYYVIVNKEKSRKDDAEHVSHTYATTLCCEELAEHRFQQKIFVSRLDLGIDHSLLICKDFFYILEDMNPTVSNSSVNMRVLRLENGSMCLCWQSTTSFYKIVILSMDLLLHCNTEKVFENIRLSFTAFGNSILVHSPVSVMHVLAIDALSPDPWNFAYHCHYLTNASELGKLTAITQLPHCIPHSINDSQESKSQCYVFEKHHKIVSGLRIDRKSVAGSFFSRDTSLENKLAITRFCAITFYNDDADESTRSSFLKNFLQSFFERDMILKGDKILGTLLIHMVANDVCGKFSQEGAFLRNLLPVAINMPQMESRDFTLWVRFTKHKNDISAQIHRATEKCDRTMHRWKKAYAAFKCGSFASFDMHSINDDIKLLQEQLNTKLSREQQSEQQEKTDLIFDNEDPQIEELDLESEEGNLNCFLSYEQDYFCENVVALTYRRLCDHLKPHILDHVLVKLIARSFATAPLRAASHLIHLVLRLLGIDEHDGPLFNPVQREERNLLQFLKQLHSACVSINFPLPPGFQTFLTCLTFRCCLTTHLIISERLDFESEDDTPSEDSTKDFMPVMSYDKEDLEEFSFSFFQNVDCKCIQLTDEFVARFLEELPNHEVFGPFVQQILQATMYSQGVLQLWKHPRSAKLLAKMQMELLHKPVEKTPFLRNIEDDDELKNSETGFAPLDTFLDDLKLRGKQSGVDVGSVGEATMQHTVLEHGKENLKHIAC